MLCSKGDFNQDLLTGALLLFSISFGLLFLACLFLTHFSTFACSILAAMHKMAKAARTTNSRLLLAVLAPTIGLRQSAWHKIVDEIRRSKKVTEPVFRSSNCIAATCFDWNCGVGCRFAFVRSM